MAIKYIKTRHEKSTPVNIITGDPTKPTVFFHHGLYGSQSGFLAQHIANLAAEENVTFISFDNLGHGQNTFPLEQAHTGKWIDTAQDVLSATISHDADIIIVGNSYGAHITHAAISNTACNVKGFLGLSAAPNVLTTRLAPHLDMALSQEEKDSLSNGETKSLSIPGHAEPKPISQAFLQAAQDYKIDMSQQISCDKVILIHGQDDLVVSSEDTSAFQQTFKNSSLNKILEMPDGHGLENSTQQITAAFYQILDIR